MDFKFGLEAMYHVKIKYIAVLACVPIGYPVISIQWLNRDRPMVGEIYISCNICDGVLKILLFAVRTHNNKVYIYRQSWYV